MWRSTRSVFPSRLIDATGVGLWIALLLIFLARPVVVALPVCGVTLAELPLPARAVVMLILRGEELIAPRGATRLEAGDHVYVFCPPEDRGLIALLFGAHDEE